MIICRICANANDLTGTPIKGSYECENCKAAGVNTGFEVDGLSPGQVAKTEVAHQTFVDRVMAGVASLAKRGIKEEPPS